MKVLVPKEKLKQGFDVIQRISPKSISLPVLNTVFLQAEKNFLSLTATDLEIGIKWWTLAKIEKSGQTLLPLSLFSGFLELFPEKPVTIQKKENNLFIECGNFKNKIKEITADDFPIIPTVQKNEFLEIPSDIFCEGVEQVVDIAVFSQTRPEISGIFFSFQDGSLKIAATDSFRLGEKTIIFDKKLLPSNLQNKNISFIIPQRTAKEIINIFKKKKNKIKLYFSTNHILIENQMTETEHPEIQLVSKLIDGEYPPYQEVIPKKYETKIILNKNEFLNHLKAAAVFSGKINEVKLQINAPKNRIDFISQNPDLGEHNSFMFAKINGNSLEISFNHRFLSSGLNNIKSQEIAFELQKEEDPVILRPVGDNTYFYVVMPIKMS